MRRYFLSPEKKQDSSFLLEKEDFHHICVVCRMEMGSKFEILLGDNLAYFVEITEKNKKSALASIREVRSIAELPNPKMHLCLSIPKFSTMDAVIEKAVELGASSIIPFVSDYSFVKKLGGPIKEKMPRWANIVQAATEQCGRGQLMPITDALHLSELLDQINRKANAKGLFAYEGAGDLSISQALKQYKPLSLQEIYIFVGSEGGFSDQEIDLFRSKDLKPVSLGPQILRVETACTALLSIIKYELVDFV